MNAVPPSRQNSNSTAGIINETEAFRIYQTWKGSNVFFLQGRFIFGPDVRSLFITIFLIVAPVTIFCAFVSRKLMNDFSQDLGIVVMVVVIVLTLSDLVLLLMTSGRDPGIVPRNAHPPELESNDGNSDAGSGETPQLHLPRTKDIFVNGVPVKIKYCDTCMLYRPPRCSHCSICNNCVERFDHHCPWVGQCIGVRNYRFFFMFVSLSTVVCIYVFGFCWLYIIKIMHSEGTSIWKAMTKTAASIALIIYTFFAVWFVGGLTVFHLYLISTNKSTYENFRYRYDRRDNPYNRGVMSNFKEIFWTSIPPSKNKFRAMVPKETDILPHAVSAGSQVEKNMVDVEMGRKAGLDPSDVDKNELQGLFSSDDSNKSVEVQNALHDSRRSSWGRRSCSSNLSGESVAIASQVGDSNETSGVNKRNWQ